MMGFYKDGKWQPSANEVASGDYPYEKDYPRTDKQRIAELEAENQRLREAHNDNLEEYEFFVKQDQTHSKLIDWKIVCGYLANRSKAALLAVLLEENQDKIARFKAWEEQEWTKKPE